MKSKNYLGKHDENRGIVIFFLVFIVVIAIIFFMIHSNNKEEKEIGVSSIDAMYSSLEDETGVIKEFKLADNNLILSGSVKNSLDNTVISNIENVQMVFKNKDGDKYAYDLDYFISTDNIEFSLLKDNNINLDKFENDEYFVFLRIKYTSQKTDEGYRYKYYTLKNDTENNELLYNNISISFGTSSKVKNYLTVKFN